MYDSFSIRAFFAINIPFLYSSFGLFVRLVQSTETTVAICPKDTRLEYSWHSFQEPWTQCHINLQRDLYRVVVWQHKCLCMSYTLRFLYYYILQKCLNNFHRWYGIMWYSQYFFLHQQYIRYGRIGWEVRADGQKRTSCLQLEVYRCCRWCCPLRAAHSVYEHF